MPYPFPDDSFQRQLDELKSRYANLSAPVAPTTPLSAANSIDYVDGVEGARSFLGKMLAGEKRIIWDSEKPVFYVLQKDANGTPARIQIGEFTLKPEPSMEDKYVTREDFNALVSKLDQLFGDKGKEGIDNG